VGEYFLQRQREKGNLHHTPQRHPASVFIVSHHFRPAESQQSLTMNPSTQRNALAAKRNAPRLHLTDHSDVEGTPEALRESGCRLFSRDVTLALERPPRDGRQICDSQTLCIRGGKLGDLLRLVEREG